MLELSGTSKSVLVVCAFASCACTVGEGKGWVRSDELNIEECWSGPFDLKPDFFGANSFRKESLLIRVQRGDNIEHVSDGLTVLVNDLQDLRGRVGEAIQVGLPRGVTPPGVPIEAKEEHAPVSLALYLHNTCHWQNSTIYSVAGTITFNSLFSGDINESSAEDRLTEATFSADFADPRRIADGETEQVTSKVDGFFRFFFQRGQPAQPFQ